MRKTLFFVFVTLCIAAPAFAQVSASVEISAPPPPSIEVGLPTVQFSAPPPLVEVSPGVRVVRDCDEEVFFHSGYYWHSRGGVWYRTRNYRGGWIVAPPRMVPGAIVRLPHGHYRHFHGGGPGWHAEQRRERHEIHAEHRAIRHELHAERRAERHEAHGGGRRFARR